MKVLLLDNQSTVNLFCNEHLVKRIWKSSSFMTVMGIRGNLTMYTKAYMEGLGAVWSSKQATANVLLLKTIRKEFKVTYDGSTGSVFTVHKPDGKNVLFRMNQFGLHCHDLTHCEITTTLSTSSHPSVESFSTDVDPSPQMYICNNVQITGVDADEDNESSKNDYVETGVCIDNNHYKDNPTVTIDNNKHHKTTGVDEWIRVPITKHKSHQWIMAQQYHDAKDNSKDLEPSVEEDDKDAEYNHIIWHMEKKYLKCTASNAKKWAKKNTPLLTCSTRHE